MICLIGCGRNSKVPFLMKLTTVSCIMKIVMNYVMMVLHSLLNSVLCVCVGTTASVTSYDSGDKRSTITSPSNVLSPLTSPNYATGHMTYTLPLPGQLTTMALEMPCAESRLSDHRVSVTSLLPPSESPY